MSLNVFGRWSLKSRVTLFTLSIFLIFLWALAVYSSRMLRADMQHLLGEQQVSTVSFMANAVNRDLADRLAVLEKISELVNPAMLGNRAALQTFLEQRVVIQTQFNGGVAILRQDAQAIAEYPRSTGKIDQNYGDVASVASALNEGKAMIGRPFISKDQSAPVFIMAVPIRDPQGVVIGVLMGSTNLDMPNFLDEITESRYGQNGYYLLEEPVGRLIITGTGKRRVMQALPAIGINPLIDRHIKGFEDTGVTTNPLGVEVLASAKRIPVANWMIVAALPTEEAFAPIYAMQQRMLLATMLLTLLAGVIIWWMLKRQLSPISAAMKTLASLAETNQPVQHLNIGRQDEIGQLIAAFNRLLEKLSLQKDALEKSEVRFRNFFEKNSSAILIVEPSTGQITEANNAAATYYGYSLAQLAGMPIANINTLPPERIAEEIKQASCEDRNTFFFRHRLASGEVRDVEVHSTPMESGGHGLLFSIVYDITARKEVLTALRASETWLRSIFENANTGIATVDLDGRISSFNAAFRKLLGYDAETLQGMALSTFTHPDDLKLELGYLTEIRAGTREHYHMTKRYIASDKRVLWVDLFITVVRDAQNDLSYFVGIVHDITARKQGEEDLRIAAVAFESQQSMMITDANRVILRVNQAFTASTGYSVEEAVGKTPKMLQSGRHNAAFYRELWKTIQHSGGWQGEVWDKRKNGEVYPKWLTISAVKNNDGCITHFVGAHQDITERKQAEEKIEALAFFDQLTKLPNRTLLLDRLKQAKTASQRSGRYSALLFLDLDNFKTLNDTLGHDIGDMLLKQVANRLLQCVRAGDTVARLGGDEFVLILSSLSTSQTDAATATEIVAEKIRDTLNQNYQIDGVMHHSTASIGATLFNGTQTSIDDLMKQSDLAMYRSKAAGRNTFCFFDPAMEVAVKERAALEGDLRQALANQQFVLHYQAQIAGENRLIGAEVLVRWQHPLRGMVSPADFIPLAEETRLILPLGHWVLDTACAQLAIWASQPGMADLTLAVNVSVHQFRQADFVAQVLTVLKTTGANPQRLKLELTESLLVDNVEEIIEKMYALKAKGVGFSLDDFGTGYSSLSYLKRLPLDQLKIDQSFVRDVLIDPNDAVIAKTIVALAQSLGLGVIAEGVETEPQRNFLASAGCHAYQGYFFSRPLPLADFEHFIQKNGHDQP